VTDSKIIYLHGFASAPTSRKAQAFRAALAAAGIEAEIPQLDGGDFEHLTIPGQLAILERTNPIGPLRLVGSSMGGYVAALYAATHPAVERLVLLAPAFGFAERWQPQWEKQAGRGPLEVYHYGSKAPRKIGYELIEDALRYPAEPSFSQPALIFHGTRDDVVPVEYSRRFAAAHSNATLREMDSDHELVDVLDQIVTEALPFLAGQ
jgi:pimeloyl-ACP methyl ester carboxylesterase